MKIRFIACLAKDNIKGTARNGCSGDGLSNALFSGATAGF